MRRTWRHGAAMLVAIVLAAPLQAAVVPSLRDLQATLLQRLQDDPRYGASLGALTSPWPSTDAAREYLLDLFADETFARDTDLWLKAMDAVGSDDPPSEWLQRYRRTLGAGLLHLNDAEIDFILRSTLLRTPLSDPTLCALLGRADPSAELLARMPRPTAAELGRYYRTLKRIYLAALANAVPRPLPPDEQVQAATLRVLTQMPEADRERLLNVWADTAPDPAEECAGHRIYLSALDGASGDTGRLLRRQFVVQMLRSALEPAPAASNVTASVVGAASGRFEPGAARLDYPLQAARAGVEGSMRVRIWVDEDGRATRVVTVERRFNKTAVTLSDGSEMGVAEMFDPVVAVYYRAGRFMPQFKDGKPHAYVVEVPIDWKLE